VLSGRDLYDELITLLKESYRLWCVIVCALENLKNEEAMTHVGSQRHRKKNGICLIIILQFTLPGSTQALLKNRQRFKYCC
jgi:hypothetical protein